MFARLLMKLPGARLDLVRSFAAHLARPQAERYLFLVAHFTRAERERVLGPRLLEAQCDVIPWFESLLSASDAKDPTNRLLDLDTQTYLPDDIFTKVDIASMAHALEVRAPLVDHVLMERMARLPARLKLRGLRGTTRLLETHARGASHGERLWNLVVLELWHRQFIDAPAARASLDSIQRP